MSRTKNWLAGAAAAAAMLAGLTACSSSHPGGTPQNHPPAKQLHSEIYQSGDHHWIRVPRRHDDHSTTDAFVWYWFVLNSGSGSSAPVYTSTPGSTGSTLSNGRWAPAPTPPPAATPLTPTGKTAELDPKSNEPNENGATDQEVAAQGEAVVNENTTPEQAQAEEQAVTDSQSDAGGQDANNPGNGDSGNQPGDNGGSGGDSGNTGGDSGGSGGDAGSDAGGGGEG